VLDERPLVHGDRRGGPVAGAARLDPPAVRRRDLRARHPLGADHAAPDPGRRRDRDRDRPEPGGAPSAAREAGRRGGARARDEGGGAMSARLRAWLARKPPGYRFTIGRILAIYSGLMVTLLLAALDQTIVATAL